MSKAAEKTVKRIRRTVLRTAWILRQPAELGGAFYVQFNHPVGGEIRTVHRKTARRAKETFIRAAAVLGITRDSYEFFHSYVE